MLALAFDIQQVLDLAAPHNIAPRQLVATVLYNAKSEKREFQQLGWGLIPLWAKDLRIGAKLINPMAQTFAKKQAFCSAFSTPEPLQRLLHP